MGEWVAQVPVGQVEVDSREFLYCRAAVVEVEVEDNPDRVLGVG